MAKDNNDFFSQFDLADDNDVAPPTLEQAVALSSEAGKKAQEEALPNYLESLDLKKGINAKAITQPIANVLGDILGSGITAAVSAGDTATLGLVPKVMEYAGVPGLRENINELRKEFKASGFAGDILGILGPGAVAGGAAKAGMSAYPTLTKAFQAQQKLVSPVTAAVKSASKGKELSTFGSALTSAGDIGVMLPAYMAATAPKGQELEAAQRALTLDEQFIPQLLSATLHTGAGGINMIKDSGLGQKIKEGYEFYKRTGKLPFTRGGRQVANEEFEVLAKQLYDQLSPELQKSYDQSVTKVNKLGADIVDVAQGAKAKIGPEIDELKSRISQSQDPVEIKQVTKNAKAIIKEKLELVQTEKPTIDRIMNMIDELSTEAPATKVKAQSTTKLKGTEEGGLTAVSTTSKVGGKATTPEELKQFLEQQGAPVSSEVSKTNYIPKTPKGTDVVDPANDVVSQTIKEVSEFDIPAIMRDEVPKGELFKIVQVIDERLSTVSEPKVAYALRKLRDTVNEKILSSQESLKLQKLETTYAKPASIVDEAFDPMTGQINPSFQNKLVGLSDVGQPGTKTEAKILEDLIAAGADPQTARQLMELQKQTAEQFKQARGQLTSFGGVDAPTESAKRNAVRNALIAADPYDLGFTKAGKPLEYAETAAANLTKQDLPEFMAKSEEASRKAKMLQLTEIEDPTLSSKIADIPKKTVLTSTLGSLSSAPYGVGALAATPAVAYNKIQNLLKSGDEAAIQQAAKALLSKGLGGAAALLRSATGSPGSMSRNAALYMLSQDKNLRNQAAIGEQTLTEDVDFNSFTPVDPEEK